MEIPTVEIHVVDFHRPELAYAQQISLTACIVTEDDEDWDCLQKNAKQAKSQLRTCLT
jgi:hypothetical protein